MKAFCLVVLVPLAYAVEPFTAFGNTYAAAPAPYAPAPYAPAPYAPAPYAPAPAPYVPAPYVASPAPYVASPAPYVAAAPAYAPIQHHAVAHHAVAHHAPLAHHAVAHHGLAHHGVAHHAVAHHAVAHHAVAHHAVVHHGYEQPKHNCSVLDVVEIAEVCTPHLETVCSPIELTRKAIKDVEQCYTVTRTVCTESTEEIDNEVCTYSYQPKTEATTAKTVEVSFRKDCEVMMVTVCQPQAGYGYHAYGHNYCKEVAQETCYNVPVVTPVNPPVDVIYPEPIKTCVNKPISLPRISCEDLSEEKCITVPEVEVVTEASEKCITALGAPACQDVELTLPKQVCKEINYGYAEDEHVPEPAPAPYAAAPPPYAA